MFKGLMLLTLLTFGGTPLGAAEPEVIGQVGGPVMAVDVAGHHAFIGEGPRLQIVDVSSRQHPRRLAQSAILPDIVSDVAVDGAHAYVTAGYAGLVLFDAHVPGDALTALARQPAAMIRR